MCYDIRGDDMKSVGIICEYNPFHNGHLYHIKKTKELFPDDTLILILSGNITQRGEISVLTKWEKTEIALHYGIDLVVELPFVYATQSADMFCYGAMKLLSYLQVEAIVFGSEIGTISPLLKCAEIQLYSEEYKKTLKLYLEKGYNYPTSLSKALKDTIKIDISKPNDLLGLGYVKEILKNNYSINPITIPRTNDYHNPNFTGTISSATSIRKHLEKEKSIENTVPPFVVPFLKPTISLEHFFPYLKYKILTEKNLEIYETVDERIGNRMKKNILDCDNLEQFLTLMKTKYYTYNRLTRMCCHILFAFTKEENKRIQNDFYLRILGFSEKGKQYLNKVKKKIEIPILTNYSNDKQNKLELEIRVTKILSLKMGKEFLKNELTGKPIYKAEKGD